MSLEKKQSKLEKISRRATGIKIIQGQPLPGSARNASYCANTRGESVARHLIPKSEGLGGFFPSSHLFLQEGLGACPWNPTSSCSPYSQVFSLRCTQHLIHVDEILRKQTLKNIFLLVTIHFSLPLAWKMGPSAGTEKMRLFHILGNTCWFSPSWVSPAPPKGDYKDNHNLFNASDWVKCETSTILSAALQNGPWWRLNDPWHMKQSHVRLSKANFIDHLRLCR